MFFFDFLIMNLIYGAGLFLPQRHQVAKEFRKNLVSLCLGGKQMNNEANPFHTSYLNLVDKWHVRSLGSGGIHDNFYANSSISTFPLPSGVV